MKIIRIEMQREQQMECQIPKSTDLVERIMLRQTNSVDILKAIIEIVVVNQKALFGSLHSDKDLEISTDVFQKLNHEDTLLLAKVLYEKSVSCTTATSLCLLKAIITEHLKNVRSDESACVSKRSSRLLERFQVGDVLYGLQLHISPMQEQLLAKLGRERHEQPSLLYGARYLNTELGRLVEKYLHRCRHEKENARGESEPFDSRVFKDFLVLHILFHRNVVHFIVDDIRSPDDVRLESCEPYVTVNRKQVSASELKWAAKLCKFIGKELIFFWNSKGEPALPPWEDAKHPHHSEWQSFIASKQRKPSWSLFFIPPKCDPSSYPLFERTEKILEWMTEGRSTPFNVEERMSRTPTACS